MNLLLYLSIIPSVVLGIYVYKQDKVEKEPTSLLLKCFIGGVFAAISVLLLSCFGPDSEAYNNNFVSLLFYSFFVVGLVEEFSKFIFTYLITYKNKAFDYMYDSLVYSSFVALGFGIFEDILYIIETNNLYIALARGFITIPAHIFFGIFMGYYLGLAKKCEIKKDNKGKDNNLCWALIIPTILHGFFDYCLFTNNPISIIMFIILVLFLYISSFKTINKLSNIKESLYDE